MVAKWKKGVVPSLQERTIIRTNIKLLTYFIFLPRGISTTPVGDMNMSTTAARNRIPSSIEGQVRSDVSTVKGHIFMKGRRGVFHLGTIRCGGILTSVIGHIIVKCVMDSLRITCKRRASVSIRLRPMKRVVQAIDARVSCKGLARRTTGCIRGSAASMPILVARLLANLPISSIK